MSHSAGFGADRVACGAVAASRVRLEGAYGTAGAPALMASRLLAGPLPVASQARQQDLRQTPLLPMSWADRRPWSLVRPYRGQAQCDVAAGQPFRRLAPA